MSKSIKLNDNTFVSTDGVIDELTKRTQSSLNNSIVYLPFIRYQDLPSQSTDNETYFREWLQKLKNDGVFRDYAPCIGLINPNSQGWVYGYCNPSNGWSSFMAMTYGNYTIYRFGTQVDQWFYAPLI